MSTSARFTPEFLRLSSAPAESAAPSESEICDRRIEPTIAGQLTFQDRRSKMNRYESRTPRAIIGLAAIALTAVTMTAAVVWPALAETAHAAGIERALITTASLGGVPRGVEVQCTPQG
jgi:hypothetical protein